jgi:NDP-mannose synthase
VAGLRAVILAGGQGTRMRPFTTVLPKPLLPIGGVPVLELILRRLAACDFRRIELSVGHLGALIQSYFETGAALPDHLELSYHWEDEPLGTAGALKLIEPGDEPFLVMNGDVITNLDYAALMAFHREQGASVTIAGISHQVTMELGVIEHEGNEIVGYREKPSMDFKVSMGVYVCDPSVIMHVPDGPFDFPDLVKKLIAAGERVALYPFEGVWFDIGTVAEYERALAQIEAHPELLEP